MSNSKFSTLLDLFTTVLEKEATAMGIREFKCTRHAFDLDGWRQTETEVLITWEEIHAHRAVSLYLNDPENPTNIKCSYWVAWGKGKYAPYLERTVGSVPIMGTSGQLMQLVNSAIKQAGSWTIQWVQTVS